MAKRVGRLKDKGFIGQDPKRRAEIEAKLFQDFQPKDVLEEIWLSEIALLTATIEYYRHLEASINYKLLNNYNLQKMLAEADAEEEASGRKKSLADERDLLGSTSFRRAMGQLNENDLKSIDTIIGIINKVRRERERIYNQFDRKRRPTIINAVKYQELPRKGETDIENMAD